MSEKKPHQVSYQASILAKTPEDAVLMFLESLKDVLKNRVYVVIDVIEASGSTVIRMSRRFAVGQKRPVLCPHCGGSGAATPEA